MCLRLAGLIACGPNVIFATISQLNWIAYKIAVKLLCEILFHISFCIAFSCWFRHSTANYSFSPSSATRRFQVRSWSQACVWLLGCLSVCVSFLFTNILVFKFVFSFLSTSFCYFYFSLFPFIYIRTYFCFLLLMLFSVFAFCWLWFAVYGLLFQCNWRCFYFYHWSPYLNKLAQFWLSICYLALSCFLRCVFEFFAVIWCTADITSSFSMLLKNICVLICVYNLHRMPHFRSWRRVESCLI